MKASVSTEAVLARTVRTAALIDGFWERWLVHGADRKDVEQVRRNLKTVDDWISGWFLTAREKEQQAVFLSGRQLEAEAENLYRISGLYYNLVYWIYSRRTPEKAYWYHKCLHSFKCADLISPIKTEYASFSVNEQSYAGRIRIPKAPVGCIVMINPIDSSKEEMFLYENDFANAGFITVSFDGPGQGNSYALQGYRASRKRWESFVDRLIQMAYNRFGSELPLFSFGTSLGASWSIYASCHPQIRKSVAVSPAVAFAKLNLPAYFLERMDSCCMLAEGYTPVPDYDKLVFRSPVFIFHGEEDLMVSTPDIAELFRKLPEGKQFRTYDGEGHCCNWKLAEIRKRAVQWFMT